MAITRHGHWALLYTSKRESPRIFVINLFVFLCVCGCVCPSYLRGFGRLGSKGDGPIVFLHFLFIRRSSGIDDIRFIIKDVF
jgi:hypothetical protein